MLELPSPVRLVALGRMRALLPEERDPVVRLQVDVLGVIDFDQQTAAVDATLIDSRIAQFALTGDLALRLGWGPNPVFLLAVGGFHPRFAAPPGFPALDRVAVALASGDNPKLRLEAYLALTSNTVQFGARVDVGARAGSFSIGGFMSFDALVTLSPLAFVVDIAAKLAVKAGGHTLLSITLALTLSGPRPWHAHGRASFSILFFDVSFGFDVTIGDPAPAALPDPVDVAPLLLAALADPRAWSRPAARRRRRGHAPRRSSPGTAILAHPLGDAAGPPAGRPAGPHAGPLRHQRPQRREALPHHPGHGRRRPHHADPASGPLRARAVHGDERRPEALGALLRGDDLRRRARRRRLRHRRPGHRQRRLRAGPGHRGRRRRHPATSASRSRSTSSPPSPRRRRDPAPAFAVRDAA